MDYTSKIFMAFNPLTKSVVAFVQVSNVITIGSGPNCGIRFNIPSMSSVHFQFDAATSEITPFETGVYMNDKDIQLEVTKITFPAIIKVCTAVIGIYETEKDAEAGMTKLYNLGIEEMNKDMPSDTVSTSMGFSIKSEGFKNKRMHKNPMVDEIYRREVGDVGVMKEGYQHSIQASEYDNKMNSGILHDEVERNSCTNLNGTKTNEEENIIINNAIDAVTQQVTEEFGIAANTSFLKAMVINKIEKINNNISEIVDGNPNIQVKKTPIHDRDLGKNIIRKDILKEAAQKLSEMERSGINIEKGIKSKGNPTMTEQPKDDVEKYIQNKEIDRPEANADLVGKIQQIENDVDRLKTKIEDTIKEDMLEEINNTVENKVRDKINSAVNDVLKDSDVTNIIADHIKKKLNNNVEENNNGLKDIKSDKDMKPNEDNEYKDSNEDNEYKDSNEDNEYKDSNEDIEKKEDMKPNEDINSNIERNPPINIIEQLANKTIESESVSNSNIERNPPINIIEQLANKTIEFESVSVASTEPENSEKIEENKKKEEGEKKSTGRKMISEKLVRPTEKSNFVDVVTNERQPRKSSIKQRLMALEAEKKAEKLAKNSGKEKKRSKPASNKQTKKRPASKKQ